MKRIEEVWSPAEFRAVVIALRALGADEYDRPAPVIDIRTRERIA